MLGKRIHKKSRPKTVRQRRANDEPVRSTSKTRDGRAEASADAPATAAPPPSDSTTEAEAREDKAEAPEEDKAEAPEAPEAPEDKAEPEAPSPDPDALDEVDDPKIGKGSDCAPDLGEESEGSDLHCD